MHTLISELTRLYLAADAMPASLAQRVQGQSSDLASLLSLDGRTRALAIGFGKTPNRGDPEPWSRLCTVANALQTELGLPAPAVSISGDSAFYLWLSLQTPAPATLLQRLAALVRERYDPARISGSSPAPDGAEPGLPPGLPPFLHPVTGRWAAFINPGLGASFADEPGLEMPPPFAGQAALLSGLESISTAQLEHALAVLGPDPEPAPAPAPASATTASTTPNTQAPCSSAVPAAPPGLLLCDATLEDIVRHLHAKNIEPTFRHLLPGQPQ